MTRALRGPMQREMSTVSMVLEGVGKNRTKKGKKERQTKRERRKDNRTRNDDLKGPVSLRLGRRHNHKCQKTLFTWPTLYALLFSQLEIFPLGNLGRSFSLPLLLFFFLFFFFRVS